MQLLSERNMENKYVCGLNVQQDDYVLSVIA